MLVLLQEPAKPVEPPKPPEKKSVYTALVGGDVYTVTQGVMKGGTVLLKDDKIFKVGPSVELPEGTTKIDVTGKRVLPGFVAASSHGIGLSSGAGKIADTLDPFSESIKLALAGGITTAFVEPGGGGGLFGGSPMAGSPGAVIKMSYGTLDGMLVSEPASVPLGSWMSGTASERYEVKENLIKARAQLEKERDFEKRRAENKLKQGETPPPRATGPLEPYVKLLKGEAMARVTAGTADEIRRALDLVGEFKFKAVLVDVIEGWTMADEIGRARAYCIHQPRAKEHAHRNSPRPSGSSIEQSAIFRKGGVKFALLPPNPSVGTGGIAGRDLLTLPLEGAFAIRGGLDEQTALESITITAAEICGVESRVGSIEEGKDADLVVLDGDPFDYRTFVELTFVNGKLLYEKSKSPYFSHLKPRK